ncbi:hypothetical protein RYX36_011368 [Vicia faba]
MTGMLRFLWNRFVFEFDHYTLSTVITATASTRHVTTFGNQLHSFAIQTSLKAHSHVANSLLSLYSKAHDLTSVHLVFQDVLHPDVYSWTTLLSALTRLSHVDYALHVFDQMPKCYVAVWNAIITGCSDSGRQDVAFNLFKCMFRMNVRPDNYTIATILSFCSLDALDYGRHVHSLVLKTGFLVRTSVVNSLISMYSNCGCIENAYDVFDETECGVRDHVMYNAMIDGFVSMERFEDAFVMFRDMHRACICLTEVTFVSVLSSCCSLRYGCQAQALAIKMGFHCGYTAVNNATITMYSCFGEINDEAEIDGEGAWRDGEGDSGNLRFDHYTLSTVITATASTRHVTTFGNQLHSFAIQTGLKSHSHVANSLLSLYSKSHDLTSVHLVFQDVLHPDVYSWTTLLSALTRLSHVDYALHVFDQMPKCYVAVWNAIITGCSDSGRQDVAFNLFKGMFRMNVRPDNYTFATILSFCSLDALDYGRHVHSLVLKTGFLVRTSVVNSLISMYSNCGCIENAYDVFGETECGVRDHVTYNAMIYGFVSMERFEDAFVMFRDMHRACICLTEVTFVSVLSSCCSLRDGCQAQALAIKMGFDCGYTAVNNATITMYSCFGEINDEAEIDGEGAWRDGEGDSGTLRFGWLYC